MKAFLFRATITFSLCVLFVFTPLLKVFASAQEDAAKFPNRPLTFISPLPPGAYPDLAVRLIAKEAEKYLGQRVVVVNKTGGGQVVMTERRVQCRKSRLRK